MVIWGFGSDENDWTWRKLGFSFTERIFDVKLDDKKKVKCALIAEECGEPSIIIWCLKQGIKLKIDLINEILLNLKTELEFILEEENLNKHTKNIPEPKIDLKIFSVEINNLICNFRDDIIDIRNLKYEKQPDALKKEIEICKEAIENNGVILSPIGVNLFS